MNIPDWLSFAIMLVGGGIFLWGWIPALRLQDRIDAEKRQYRSQAAEAFQRGMPRLGRRMLWGVIIFVGGLILLTITHWK